MHDEIQRKIEKRMHEPSAPGARLPGWVSAALLAAGLTLPTVGCWTVDGPAAVYAGPPPRDSDTQPQPPPDEPAGKKGAPDEADAKTGESMRPPIEAVPIYAIRR